MAQACDGPEPEGARLLEPAVDLQQGRVSAEDYEFVLSEPVRQRHF